MKTGVITYMIQKLIVFFLLVLPPPHLSSLDTIQPKCFASIGARGIRPTWVKFNVAHLSTFPYVFLLDSFSSIKNWILSFSKAGVPLSAQETELFLPASSKRS